LDGCLIAAGWTDPSNWIAALEVCLGLGLIIFVHELGHFAVAKICGVRVDKFFLGFDFPFGLKFFSFRWGETVYGVGILPLGGYVKMLGQEDNPAQLRKEIERAKLEAAKSSVPARPGPDSSVPARPGPNSSADPDSAIDIAAAEKVLFDPRSYLAKSVPQRMAIISAGVIMNMIFAVVFATVAFLVGVKQIPTVVGNVMAGGAAWQAGLLPDDEVLEVAGRPVHNFRRMTEEVVNADLVHGIPLLVKRAHATDPITIVVQPEQLMGAPRIGVVNSFELRIVKEKGSLPVFPDSAAAHAKGPFLPGDRIVKIDGVKVDTYGELEDILAARAGEDLRVTVARSKEADGKAGQPANTEEVEVTVPKSPMKQFGLVMAMGPIAALQTDSPAVRGGLKVGDVLTTVDGEPIGDPLTWPNKLHKKAGQEIKLGLIREGKPMVLAVKLTSPTRHVPPAMPDSPVAISELGAAYFVLNNVAAVEPGSPAAEAGFQKGDLITQAKILPPSREELAELRKSCQNDDLSQNEATLAFSEKERNWPFFMVDLLQDGLPGTTVEFTWKRGDETKTAKLTPVPAKDWFNSQPGWNLEAKSFVQKADSFSEALRWGGKETLDAALLVYRTLHSLVGTGQISIRNISGPWGIVTIALMAAKQGLGTFLIFLTLISANLAVVNFLPIPVLDGGHIVLLLYEGIRGKPADERVQEILTWIGLILILSLMIFVFGLDLGFIPRPGAH
jgi:regulator of sigma E protease